MVDSIDNIGELNNIIDKNRTPDMVDIFGDISELTNIGAKKSIPEKVSAIILNYVQESNLQPGDKLPSEQQLSSTLSVSSRSVREALKILQARGFIQIMHGKGAFLIDEVYANFIDTLTTSLQFSTNSRTLILNLVEVRKIIETAAIETTSRNRTNEDLKKLGRIVDKMDQAAEMKDQELFNSFDVAFHKTVVDCGRNKILIIFYNALIDLIFESFKKTGFKSFSNQETLQSHRKMFEAIQDNDAPRAKKLLLRQLQMTEKTLLEEYRSEDGD